MYVAVCIRYFKKEGDFIKLYNLPVPETRCEQSELFEEWIGLHIEDGEKLIAYDGDGNKKVLADLTDAIEVVISYGGGENVVWKLA